MDHSSWFAIYDDVTLVDQALRLLGQLAVLLVVRSVVRRHRPDVWPRFRAWAFAALLAALVIPIGWRIVIEMAKDNFDTTAPTKGMIVVTVVDFAFYAAVTILLVRALVRVAQPPPPVVVPAAPPYR